jgi:shikimate kinase
VLVGAMGSGKTTIGRRVAAALGRPFVDNDELLQRSAGASAAEIAARDGVDALHRLEAATLLDALAGVDASVIAAAASTITDSSVRSALSQAALVVWLRADLATLAARLPGSPTRPFRDDDPARLVAEQSRERDPLFASVADVTLDTGSADAGDVVARVLASADERGLRV